MSAKTTNPIKSPQTVGGRLKLWRKSSQFTLVEVSKLLGTSQGSLSDLENNKSLPSSKTLIRLCQKTDLSMCWLLTGKGSVNRLVGYSEEKSGDQALFMQLKSDKSFKEILNLFLKIFKTGDRKQKAKLEGFLSGMVKGKND